MKLIDKLLHRKQKEEPVVEEPVVEKTVVEEPTEVAEPREEKVAEVAEVAEEPVEEKVIDPLDAERNITQEGVPSFL
ncbi:MAG: hypothetical protein KAS32_24900 [Candidatus Peribacteraceae bacterium]|nr:hypothetical protein [Candidatus Peribacteraceae bacterium]